LPPGGAGEIKRRTASVSNGSAGFSGRQPAFVVTKICSETVQADFNDASVVMHYARAAHQIGLWASERLLIERWLPDRTVPLFEVGCGAGRVALGLWDLGYHDLTAADFAGELLEQARRLAALRAAEAIRFVQADARQLEECNLLGYITPGETANSASAHDHFSGDFRPGEPNEKPPVVCNVLRYKSTPACARAAPEGFAGALFLFNGLMQIPGRENRRQALREIRAVCRPGAVFLFTTHDREDDPRDQSHWAAEAERWTHGQQDPRLLEFGDRYFRNDHGGHTFMHLPTQTEVREDLAATGWNLQFDAMRRTLAPESSAVREFSDECRFWVAKRN
jgi:SAM-dependent methyltransferase